MSASNEWTEWHLTPRGWKGGTEKIDVEGIRETVPPPADRVLTCRYYETLPSTFSEWDRGVKQMWSTSDKKLIDELLEKFGSCPERL